MLSKVLSFAGIHTQNLSSYPVTASRYLVITNTSILGFSRITGLMLRSSDILAINEGGTERPYLVRQTQSSYNTLTLEKGFGTYEVMRAMAKMNYLLIIIRDHSGYMKGAYYLDDAIIKDVSLSELDAKSSNVLIQSMTIAYHSLKRQDKLMKAAMATGLAGRLLGGLSGGQIGPLLNIAERYITKDGIETRNEVKARDQYEQNLSSGTTAAQQATAATNPDILDVMAQNNQADSYAKVQEEKQAELERQEITELENAVEMD